MPYRAVRPARAPARAMLMLSILTSVGCVSAGERARFSALQSSMEATRFTQDCETLASAASDTFRADGFSLPGDEKDESFGLSFSAGSSTETKTETSSSVSFSFGGGGKPKEDSRPAQPAAVVNTLPKRGVSRRLECFIEARGSRIAIYDVGHGESSAKKSRNYQAELALLDAIDGEKATAVRHEMDRAESEASK